MVRQSPTESATLYKKGIKKKGNDGKMWKIIETSNGVKRWSRVTVKERTLKKGEHQLIISTHMTKSGITKVIKMLNKNGFDGNGFFQYILSDKFKRTINGKKRRLYPSSVGISRWNRKHGIGWEAQLDVKYSGSTNKVIHIKLDKWKK